MDDRMSVRQARSLGLLVLPTMAVYIQAKRAGHIASLAEKADLMKSKGFRLSSKDYRAILNAAGER